MTRPCRLTQGDAANRWPGGAMTSSQHVYEVRRRKDKRGFDLISDALPFGQLLPFQVATVLIQVVKARLWKIQNFF
jgi:hypothetical protein